MDCAHPLPPQGLYVRQNARGVQYWNITRQGDTVTMHSGRDLKNLKARSRTFPNAQKAIKYVDTTRGKKMREGYLFRRPTALADAGDVVVRALLPHSQQHHFFDVHPDGTRLLISSEQRPANHNAWLYEVDLTTASTRQIFHDDGAWTGASQTFTHCALYHGTQHALFSVNGRTWRVDLDGDQATALASYNGNNHDTHFNSHCVRTCRTPDYNHALLFDKGDMVRVVDAQGVDLKSFCVGSRKDECIAGALSNTGQWAAFCLCTHDGINRYKSTLEVYEVATGTRIANFALATRERMDTITFSPDEEHLILREWTSTPIAQYHRQTGVLQPLEPHWKDQKTWAWNPTGDILALGSHDVTLHTEGHEPRTLVAGIQHWGIKLLTFSPQSDILYAGLAGGEIVGWKL